MPDPATELPLLREGLFQRDPPRLLGTACGACGTRTFPARAFCPQCHATTGLTQVPLGTTGTVHSWTIVRQAPGRRPTPYTLAYVDLEDGVRLLAQLDHRAPEPTIGMPVTLSISPMVMDDGSARLGYRFTECERGAA